MILGAARVAPEKAVFRPVLPMSCLPGISEMQMATMTFKEQYFSPNWQRKRLEVMQDANFSCENCGDTDTTLNVHHKRYVKGRMVWEYERSELQCLCEPCHRTHHDARASLDALLLRSSMSLQGVVALMTGIADGNCELDEPANVPDGFTAEFELGILVSILDCQMSDTLHRAFQATGLTHLTPTQKAAVDRWRKFAIALEKSGL